MTLTCKRLALVLTMMACSVSVSSALGQVVTIDFENFLGPDGKLGTADDILIDAPDSFDAQFESLTNQYEPLGILFTPDPRPGDRNEILNSSSFTTPAGHTFPNLLASTGTESITGRFVVPVFEIGALIGISTGSDQLSIFGADGTLLDSIIGNDEFVSLTSTVAIDRFEIVAVASTTPAIDNLTFTAVPEPSCLGAIGFGVLAWLGRTRRKRVC